MAEVPYPAFYPTPRPSDYPVYTNPPIHTSYVMSPQPLNPSNDELVAATLKRIESRLTMIEEFLKRFIDDGK